MFLLFYGDTYYPGGGVNDFGGVFASAEEAMVYHGISYDWAHVAVVKDGALRITHVYRTGGWISV